MNKYRRISNKKLEHLKECARYILEFEFDDWELQVFNGEPYDNHCYTIAVLALYGQLELNRRVKDVLK